MKINIKTLTSTLAVIATIALQTSSATAQSVNVTVNAASSYGQIPAPAHGVNASSGYGGLTDAAKPALLQAVNTNALRFPSGIPSDVYHWSTNSTIQNGVTTQNPVSGNFDSLMWLAEQTGSYPVITVNYGSNETDTAGGDPNEAAAWVAYAKSKGYWQAYYWEIGNEQFDNGEYGGVNSETDLHSSHSPVTYGQNVNTYISTMKAQNPNISCGVNLVEPGVWPDGVSPDWNSNVLEQCGANIGFVIIHWYPEGQTPTDAGGLASPEAQIPQMVAQTRALINRYCGANAPNVQIFITETAISAWGSKQGTNLVSALFAADETELWLENGIGNVNYEGLQAGMWVLWNPSENINVCQGDLSSSLYGNYIYADGNWLANPIWSGYLPNSGTLETEPAYDTPFPPYYGEQMLAELGKAGDYMVSSSTNQPLVVSHAVRNANGNISVMLINESPTSTYTANVSLAGYSSSWSNPSTTYFYGEPSSAVTSTNGTAGSTYSISLPPYSITTTTTTSPAEPIVTASASPAKLTVAPNTQDVVSMRINNFGATLTNATDTITIYNLAGTVIAQSTGYGLTLNTNGYFTGQWGWGGTSAPTTYILGIKVTNAAGTIVYYSNNNLGSFMVTPTGAAPTTPSFTMTASANPSSVAAGSTTNITVAYTNSGAAITDGFSNVQTYLGGYVSPDMTVTPFNCIYGQTVSETYPWTAPTTPGTYTVEGGVFPQDWSTNYGYNGNMASIVVYPSAPTFVITATANPSTVAPGGTTNITMSYKDVGLALTNGIVNMQVFLGSYSSATQYTTGLNWTYGQTQQVTYQWTATTTPGTYTVEGGVFGSGWTPNYTYTNPVTTVTVN